MAAKATFVLAGSKVLVSEDCLVATEQIETGCPPPSHRTRLEPESGTGIFNAETERQNRPIWPVFVGRDRANQRLSRACL
jgi:hypothetical protein